MKTLPLEICECGHHVNEHIKGGRCSAYCSSCPCLHFAPRMRALKLNEQKRLVMIAFEALCPFVRVNGVHPEAKVPKQMERPDLTIRVGEYAQIAYTTKLEVSDVGFSGEVWVRGDMHTIFIPWEAVDAMWIREPFEGPLVSWKDLPEITAPTPGRRAHLRLVAAPAENTEKEK